VKDENGRRRFHGAFTGGFSAGYWNTVGSKDGKMIRRELETFANFSSLFPRIHSGGVQELEEGKGICQDLPAIRLHGRRRHGRVRNRTAEDPA
jgi:hypothetical protein